MTTADSPLLAGDFPGFPVDFLWGASTAAYQIEGAVNEGGRGASVWDTFCAEPGRIADGSSGAVACDHFHRYPEDIALMQQLGLGAYRFSIAWPRIQPTGSGPANPEGIAFYDRLIDALLQAGIKPMATLFHWDTPQTLQDGGGWLNRETALRFGEYAALAGERFADRVAMWAPVNEPNVVTMLGHALGRHAPGQALMLGALPVAHHLLLGHGLAVQALRGASAQQIGCANNHSPVWPASASDSDQDAATAFDLLWNRLFADPMLLGRYPEGFAELMPGPVADDLTIIASPIDWYGMNYYNPSLIGAPGASEPVVDNVARPAELPFALHPIQGYPLTDFGWPVVPDGLREMLVQLKTLYGEALPQVHITENGCSFANGPDDSRRVPDRRRIDYLDGHLRAVRQAIDEGVDVGGYFCWSLLDNFEWAEGYRQRFGLVHIDYDSQQRTPKDSFHWYAEVIRRGAR
jgi:beta-glucosidase